MEARPLVVIVGETASGKSALAMRVAEAFNGEIICADSRTIYRGMDIGTAKPTNADRAKIPHYLLDVVSPNERFTVVDFKRLASEAIEDIGRRGKLPILAGGTGLYVDAVIFDYTFSTPEEAAKRDPTNPRHLMRSNPSARSQLRDNTLLIGLVTERETLKERIQIRIDTMLEDGFLEEVKNLYKQYGNVTALQGTGYRAFREYIEGQISLEEAKAQFVANDLHLAKRQRTWFKRNKAIEWFEDRDAAYQRIADFL